MPHFAEPVLTQPGASVCAVAGATPPEQRPLPALTEPALTRPATCPPADSSTEPLVAVDHPRVTVLANYLEGGWSHARHGAWLRETTMDRLGAAAQSLPDRWGICVFDAWRPLALQAELYDAAYGHPGLPRGFVSPPDPDPTTPPPHLTGGTVDCSLTLDGIPLALGCGFDDFTDRAVAAALENEPGIDRQLRRWLYWTMRSVGFVILECEWWHFEYGTRRWAAINHTEPLYGPAEPTEG